MLKNYFILAVRQAIKQKFYTLINLIGLATGVLICLFIMLYVIDELSFDSFHKDADRIYKIGLHAKIGDQEVRSAHTCIPLGEAMLNTIPEVESTLRMIPFYEGVTFRYEDKVFSQKKIFYVDPNFFDFFSFHLKQGDPKTVLKEPNTVVLTQELATVYFGSENPIGKMITIGDKNKAFRVTGVSENTPSNSHRKYKALLSIASHDKIKQGKVSWLNNNMFTYFKLRSNANVSAVHDKFKYLVETYVGQDIEKFMGITIEQMKKSGGLYGYSVTPLRDIHLHATTTEEIQSGGNLVYIYFLGTIGLFIIVIASINFMNLSTARSAGRAKEIALRKTFGAQNSQLIRQFLVESTIITLCSVLLACIAGYLLLPFFNYLSGKQLVYQELFRPVFIFGLLFLTVLVSILAGSYPAFYLTSFNPIEGLKGLVSTGFRSKEIRRVFVVFQFALSIFLVILTLVVYEQVRYMQSKNLGIDKENILVLHNVDKLDHHREAFRQDVLTISSVQHASYTNNSFPGVNNTTVFKTPGSDQNHIMGIYYADYDHQKVMQFELTEGRYFSSDFPSDSTAIIINEAAVREFGFQYPLQGEILSLYDASQTERLRVIGVVQNFNFESFKTNVRPLAIRFTRESHKLLIRYTQDPLQLVSQVKEKWAAYNSGSTPFSYTFLDEDFDELFRVERRMGILFAVFSGIAILVAFIGLFGLAAFSSEQRTKEVGIHKILGASIFQVIFLLSREYILLVIIAFLPASILSYYISSIWLEGFVDHTTLSLLLFIEVGLAALLVAWLTVAIQLVRTARSNPIHALRVL